MLCRSVVAPHDRIVENHQIVLPGTYRAVGDVVDVGHQIVAVVVLRDERPHLDVLDRHFLETGLEPQDLLEPLFGERAVLVKNPFGTDMLAVFVQSSDQSEKGALGRIGNIGENRIFDVVVDAAQDLRHEQRAQPLAFAVDVAVASAREVDSFERAGADGLRRGERFDREVPVAADDQHMARLQFPGPARRAC